MLTNNTNVDPIVASPKEIAQDVDRARFEQVEHNRYKSGEIFTVGAFGDLDFGPAPGELVQKVADVPSVLTAEDMKSYTPTIVTNVAVQVNIASEDPALDIDVDQPPKIDDEEVWNRPYTRDALDRMCAHTYKYDEKDLGNAQRFEKLFPGKFRYMHALKSWYFFNGSVWVKCSSGQAETAMQDTIFAIKDEIEVSRMRARGTPENSRERGYLERVSKHFVASSTADKIESALRAAKMFTSMKVDRLEMDGPSSDYLFNALNGTIDLRTGVLREFSSKDLIARTSNIFIAETSDCPVFKQLLDTVFLGDKELAHYFMKTIGGSMIGEEKESQEFYLLQGLSGSNGKSTIFKCYLDIMGTYVVASDASSWTGESQKGGASHSTDMVRLDNARGIVVSELGQDKTFNEDRIKPFCGGDRMIARDLGVQSIELRSNGTLFLSSNHRQRIKASDTSMWRRNKSLPFNAKFTNSAHEKVGVDGFTHEGDPTIAAKLRAEYPQIFRFFVEYCLIYQQEKLRDVPAAVVNAVQAHRESSDTVLEFLRECCTIEESDKMYTKTGSLYETYQSWVKKTQGQQTAMQRKSFVEAMARLGHKEGDTKKYSNARVIPKVVMHHNLDF